jgi:hypothetical protein
MPARLNGSTSGYTELSAPAVAGNNTLILPANNGINTQSIVTDGSGNLGFQWSGGSLYYRLNSDVVGANVTTAQSMFGVGVTLASNTIYLFDYCATLYRSGATTSHRIGIGFGGAATVNNFFMNAVGGTWNALPTTGGSTLQANTWNSVTSSLFSGTSVASPQTFQFQANGSVSINVGGTFIPQYTLSAAPGSAYSTIAGSYIRFTPVGSSGSNSSQGTWS